MKEEEMSHPAAPKLEAIAAGDDAGPIAAHLRVCEACASYVARLGDEAAAFRGRADGAAFVEGVRARGAREARAEARKGRIAWLAGPALAAAAAMLLWLRASPELPPRGAPSGPASQPADVARFKGGLAVAAIRDREGGQERFTGPFDVEPLDRVRIEVAVDHEEPVTAGLLSDDGTWTPLLSPVSLPVGTHYSDLAARFDDSPMDAVLLVGSPREIERARATRNFEGVVAWRVKSRPKR
jgi:hypothetical protein